MENNEVTLDSGAKLVVTIAPFSDANRLLKAILRSVKGGAPLSEVSITLDDIRKSPDAFSGFLDKAIAIATSDEVEQALFKCMERVTYDNFKVTRDLFDHPNIGEKARRDYYTICYKVIEANCKPFFVQTFSALKGQQETISKSPE